MKYNSQNTYIFNRKDIKNNMRLAENEKKIKRSKT